MEDAFVNVNDEKAFWVRDGKVLHSIYDLAMELKSMNDETFRHHVNKQKNDFSEWIRNVFNNEELANELARVVTKDKAELIVLRHIIKRLTHKL